MASGVSQFLRIQAGRFLTLGTRGNLTFISLGGKRDEEKIGSEANAGMKLPLTSDDLWGTVSDLSSLGGA